jgi:hypothetical protein
MGLVEEIYPDKYGVVRQVLVRTSNGKLKEIQGNCVCSKELADKEL